MADDNHLHESYSRACVAIWDAYLDYAHSELVAGADTTELGRAAQLAFLSCAARVAADLGTSADALSEQVKFCLEQQLRAAPRWG